MKRHRACSAGHRASTHHARWRRRRLMPAAVPMPRRRPPPTPDRGQERRRWRFDPEARRPPASSGTPTGCGREGSPAQAARRPAGAGCRAKNSSRLCRHHGRIELTAGCRRRHCAGGKQRLLALARSALNGREVLIGGSGLARTFQPLRRFRPAAGAWARSWICAHCGDLLAGFAVARLRPHQHATARSSGPGRCRRS